MGCANGIVEQNEEMENRCGKCKVGKLTIRLIGFELHSIKMNLENINHLKLYMEYGAEQLDGLGLWKFEEEPDLFVFDIPIHRCCRNFTRTLIVSIKNTETENNAFGFLELNKFVGNCADKQQTVCFLNYRISPAGKLKFSISFEEILEYEEFAFQIYQAAPRLRAKDVEYHVKIKIGEETLKINNDCRKGEGFQWKRKIVSARVPLDLITDGKIQLFSVNKKGKDQFIGEQTFSLSPFKDQTNEVNIIDEKIGIEDNLERIVRNQKGEVIESSITGYFFMFVTKKEKEFLLEEEPLSPEVRGSRVLRRRHLLDDSQSVMRLRKKTFHEENVLESKNNNCESDNEMSSMYSRRVPMISMPPLEIYNTIRKMSMRKPKFKDY